MSPEILPLLFEVLETGELEKVSEVADAIGFLVFYNRQLATEENARLIYQAVDKYKEKPLVYWKLILCLSAFPLDKTEQLLIEIERDHGNDIFSKEANRSLKLIRKHND